MQNAEFTERISPFSTNQYSYIMQQLLNSEINIKSEPNKKKIFKPVAYAQKCLSSR